MGSEIVLDSSVLVAIVSGEADANLLLARTGKYPTKLVGSPTLLEAAMVLIGRKQLKAEDLATFLAQIGAVVAPFDHRHAQVAIDAFEKYGRGRHPAGLNFGDCMSYAVAKVAGAPLLFTGEDFPKTDIKPG